MSVSAKWAVLKGLLALMGLLALAAAAVVVAAGVAEIEIQAFEAYFDNLTGFLFHFQAELVQVFKSNFEVEILSDLDSYFALHFVFCSEVEQHNEHMIEAENIQLFSNQLPVSQNLLFLGSISMSQHDLSYEFYWIDHRAVGLPEPYLISKMGHK